jgi:hypothetical protein
VKVGAQYLGFGDAAKATEALQRGIKKGSLAKGEPDAEAARATRPACCWALRTCAATTRAEAAKAFRSVKEDPTMVRIAKLWLLNT